MESAKTRDGMKYRKECVNFQAHAEKEMTLAQVYGKKNSNVQGKKNTGASLSLREIATRLRFFF